jgi:hypothetical protein
MEIDPIQRGEALQNLSGGFVSAGRYLKTVDFCKAQACG